MSLFPVSVHSMFLLIVQSCCNMSQHVTCDGTQMLHMIIQGPQMLNVSKILMGTETCAQESLFLGACAHKHARGQCCPCYKSMKARTLAFAHVATRGRFLLA